MGAEQSSEWLLTRPDVDAARAEELAAEHFGVRGTATELGSQQDRNYLIVPDEGPGILLKIHHSSFDADELDIQRAVSDQLRASGIATPEVLTAASGDRLVRVEVPGSEPSWVSAFAHVQGQTLADIDELPGARIEQLGTLVGRVASSLAPLSHSAADRSLQWELGRALEVIENLIDDLPAERREPCLAAARAAAAQVDAVRPELPTQIIHGDLTSDNVMIDAQGTMWVIDLGDAATSWRIAELAMLAADVLGRTGSPALVGRSVRGFAAAVADDAPVSDAELAALWPLVVLRGAVLAVSGYSQLRIDPDNAYARERMEHEWQVFKRATAVDSARMLAELRLAAGHPHRPALQYAPLLDGLDQAQVIDLGVRSASLDDGRWLLPDIEQDLAAETLQRAPVAFARFGEARLTRATMRVEERRSTRARFVEVWSTSGTDVRAPFGGVVRVHGDRVEIRDDDVVLAIDGLQASVDEGPVSAGDTIGSIAGEASGIGHVLVSRFSATTTPAAAFALPHDEYEVEGALDPSVILGVPSAPDPLVELDHQRHRRDLAMGGAAERYYEHPPQFERGWDTRLIDTLGQSYLDMVNNVTAIGHSHPRLADAVARQLRLLNTNSRFLYEAYADFTEKLLATSPDPSLDTVIPVNSGSEAVDLALKLAQVATGRRDVIAVREGYHGWTMPSDSVSTSAFDNPSALASRPDWVHLVDAPNSYRGEFRGADAADRYADGVDRVLGELEQRGTPAAAFLCEPVFGNAGGVTPPGGYLDRVYAAVRDHGGLVIADEVQVGYGRLGGAFWGSELLGVVPDIMAVAKAAGNAYPVGAVITRREIVDALRDEGMFFSSAAGAPASAVAGATVLDVIQDQDLQGNAARVGAYLKDRLERLADRHPIIGTIHGTGLYQGIELVRDRETLEPAVDETAWVSERLLDFGVIMQPTSERQNVLKVKPPMTLTTDDADVVVDAFDRVLSELAEYTPRLR